MKIFRRICSLGLIFSLFMSMTVFGADTSANVSGRKESDTKWDLSDVKASDALVDQLSRRTLKNASNVGSSQEMEAGVVYTYAKLEEYMADEDHLTVFAMNTKGQVEDCTFTAGYSGKFYLEVLAGKNNEGRAKVDIIRDSDNERIGTMTSSLEANQAVKGFVPVVKGKKYHVRFTDVSSSSANGAYGAIGCIISSSTSRTFASSYASNNFSIGAGTNSSGNQLTSYWKKYVSKKGRLAVTAADITDADYNVYITLLDSKKNVVSSKIALKDQTAYFGVSGDKNYYVKVQTSAPIYGIKCSRTSYSSTPGTSKSKATKLSKGSSKSSTLAASTSSSSSHWYKITLSSRKNLKMDFAGYVSPGASVKMELRKSNGDVMRSLKITGKKSAKMEAYIKGTNVPKETYYIKISKVSSKSSAAYKLTYTY